MTISDNCQEVSKKNNGGMDLTFHQGLWLKRRIARKGVSNSAFARKLPMSRGNLQRLFTLSEIDTRRHATWRILEELGLRKEADRLGIIKKADHTFTPTPRNKAEWDGLEGRWSSFVVKELMQAEQRGSLVDEAAYDPNVEPYSEVPVEDVPIIELPIAAGRMVEMPDVEELNDPSLLRQMKFRVRIRGDSMEKKFPDGSLIEFHCLKPDCGDGNGSKLEAGKAYYVQAAERATFKTLESFDDEKLIFAAINKKKYPAKIVLSRQEISRMAKATAIIGLV